MDIELEFSPSDSLETCRNKIEIRQHIRSHQCVETRQRREQALLLLKNKTENQKQSECSRVKRSRAECVAQWHCGICRRECLIIDDKSLCICGHIYGLHPRSKLEYNVLKQTNNNLQLTLKPFQCAMNACNCSKFFFIVAEGAWILRCRCKHRHTDHNPNKASFPCTFSRCQCKAFTSPWICSCNHSWSSHRQVIEKKTATHGGRIVP